MAYQISWNRDWGMINNVQSHNRYDHSEGYLLRKCTVDCQSLCSASTAISGDAAVGGCKDIQYLYSLTLSNIQTGRSGDRTHTQDVCGLVTYNESKHNVWLKTDLLVT